MSKVKFKDVPLKGEFVHRNTLFIKSSDKAGYVQGSKGRDIHKFTPDAEVGKVKAKASANATTPTDNNDGK